MQTQFTAQNTGQSLERFGKEPMIGGILSLPFPFSSFPGWEVTNETGKRDGIEAGSVSRHNPTKLD